MNRRRFLEQVHVISGGVLCGSALLSGCAAGARTRYVGMTRMGDRIAVSRAEMIEGSGALVEVPGIKLPLYLHSHGGDRFSAVSTRCMHRGCEVEPAADRLACPCHGSQYTLEGAVLKGPTERPLAKYRVSADPTTIYIHLTPEGV
jgi:cytochrome b6-f complex iron-sulfur subunit